MSVPLTADEKTRYTAIIDNILRSSDLNTVTRKKIRVGLEEALDGKDLSDQKEAIKRLIEARFDAISGADQEPIPPSSIPTPKRQANGHAASDEEAQADEIEVSTSAEPARKKQKRSESLDADAKLAAELQAQENQLARARSTRGGGGSGAKAVKKKATKKKSAKRVRGSDESGAESEEEEGKKRKGGGFQKPFNLSPNLAELVGEAQLSRPQVVKKLWEHIKANELQDPKDKRQIICDEKMQAVFKQSKVDMFQMNKVIGNHLYPVDEE
ncbi:hypothetical protein VUR80DRAFT_6571 [Thermomyces stellatus]